MKPKTSARDLPPRMLRRTRKLASGKVWTGYYYNGYQDGKRVEIPLGTDLAEAKRKWADLEHQPADYRYMKPIFDRYMAEIVPQKSQRSQKDDGYSMAKLRAIFDNAPIDAITPQHIAQYRDKRSAKVRANRELALFSHVFNLAREWGYTANENPCRGVRKNKETPRDYYAENDVWDAVYNRAGQELRDAMDISYLTGQRPADVLKMLRADIKNDELIVKQNKTGMLLRIQLNDEKGEWNKLGMTLDAIRRRSLSSFFLVSTEDGRPLTKGMLRLRFEKARGEAAQDAEDKRNTELAERIRNFQYRDLRAKAASDMKNIHAASQLLGHTEDEITKTVYVRVGAVVKPVK